MGAKNDLTIRYMNNPFRFADVFNYFLYKGEQVIKPEQLHATDSRVIAIVRNNGEKRQYKKPATVEQHRDLLKYLVMRDKNRIEYRLLLGIENQSTVDALMPLRNVVYDSLQLKLQSDDYKRRKYLIPVITLVLYFGADKWPTPRTLSEMYDPRLKKLFPYALDYKLNLILSSQLEEGEFNQFQSSLGDLLWFFKHPEVFTKRDKETQTLLMSNPRFTSLDVEAAEILREFSRESTGLDLILNKHEGENTVNIGEAILAGQNAAKAEGRTEGITEERNSIIRRLLAKGKSFADIADICDVSLDYVQNLSL